MDPVKLLLCWFVVRDNAVRAVETMEDDEPGTDRTYQYQSLNFHHSHPLVWYRSNQLVGIQHHRFYVGNIDCSEQSISQRGLRGQTDIVSRLLSLVDTPSEAGSLCSSMFFCNRISAGGSFVSCLPIRPEKQPDWFERNLLRLRSSPKALGIAPFSSLWPKAKVSIRKGAQHTG
jgi:hypothetical protein